MDELTEVQFLKAIAEHKVNFNVCDMDSGSIVLKNKVAQKRVNNASDTIIFFGELASAVLGEKELPVVAKVFVDKPNDEAIEGLKYEAKVYKRIMSKIIENNYSPNFIGFVGYAECADYNILSTEQYNQLNPAETKLNIGILITERAGNGAYFGMKNASAITSLYDFAQEASQESLNKVIFQILFALDVLQRFRIVHNDMHAWNVLVAKFEQEIELGFEAPRIRGYAESSEIEETYKFQFKTKYIPYLFDWDFAYAESLGPNPKIDSYYKNKLLIDNVFSSRKDLYTLLCTIQFKGGIGELYNTEIVQAKEEGRELNVNMYQMYQFLKYKSNNAEVIKLSGRQFNDIINENMFPEGNTVINMKISYDKGLQMDSFKLSEKQAERIRSFGYKYDAVGRFKFTWTPQDWSFIFNTNIVDMEESTNISLEIKDGMVGNFKGLLIKEQIMVKMKKYIVQEDVSDLFFRMTYDQANTAFHLYEMFANATNLSIKLVNYTDKIKIYNPFQCRIATIPDNLPTPYEIMIDNFLDLQVEDITAKFRYKLPDFSETPIIHIDPETQEEGRAKIQGKPRFPPQQSGYVRKR